MNIIMIGKVALMMWLFVTQSISFDIFDKDQMDEVGDTIGLVLSGGMYAFTQDYRDRHPTPPPPPKPKTISEQLEEAKLNIQSLTKQLDAVKNECRTAEKKVKAREEVLGAIARGEFGVASDRTQFYQIQIPGLNLKNAMIELAKIAIRDREQQRVKAAIIDDDFEAIEKIQKGFDQDTVELLSTERQTGILRTTHILNQFIRDPAIQALELNLRRELAGWLLSQTDNAM